MCCCFMDSFYPRDERPDKSTVVDTLDDGGGNWLEKLKNKICIIMERWYSDMKVSVLEQLHSSWQLELTDCSVTHPAMLSFLRHLPPTSNRSPRHSSPLSDQSADSLHPAVSPSVEQTHILTLQHALLLLSTKWHNFPNFSSKDLFWPIISKHTFFFDVSVRAF